MFVYCNLFYQFSTLDPHFLFRQEVLNYNVGHIFPMQNLNLFEH